MSVLDQVRLVIYRFHEKGLEVLLINTDLSNDPDVWKIPDGALRNATVLDANQIIELENEQEGLRTIAIEADWHEIPSVRGLIKHDVKLVKNTIKKAVPELEEGTYFAVKEAFKKVLPNEYKALKELKDILLDRNVLMNI